MHSDKLTGIDNDKLDDNTIDDAADDDNDGDDDDDDVQSNWGSCKWRGSPPGSSCPTQRASDLICFALIMILMILLIMTLIWIIRIITIRMIIWFIMSMIMTIIIMDRQRGIPNQTFRCL